MYFLDIKPSLWLILESLASNFALWQASEGSLSNAILWQRGKQHEIGGELTEYLGAKATGNALQRRSKF